MKSYKYLGKESAEYFLNNKTIRFSQPKAFNDPFELQPELYVEDSLLKHGHDYPCKFVLHGHESMISKYLLKEQQNTQTRKIDSISLLSQLNEQIGILCLTQADSLLPSNSLMWAHYAESHQGIVIEFNNDSEFISNAANVHYVHRRPILNSKILYENEYVAIDDLYFKSIDWMYENEIRVTRKLDTCNPIDRKDALGNEIYVSAVPIDSIECIYIGCNASDKIKSLSHKLHISTNVKVMYLKVHDEEYKLIPFTSFGGTMSEIYELQENLLFNREKT